MINPRFHPGVSAQVRLFVNRSVRAANDILQIDHPIRLTVVPFTCLAGPDESYGFAAFSVRKNRPEIWMAGMLPTKRSPAVWLRENLAHELVHYEQFRDGKKIQERGVEVRARTLFKLIEKAERL